MNDRVYECQRLRKEEERKTRESAEARGAFSQIVRELSETFDVLDVESAKKLLVKEEKKLAAKIEEEEKLRSEYYDICEGRAT